MDSRTPIRLTPHRGPLATPSASPASSPTSSTPPNDSFCCSPATPPTLDVAIFQRKFSALSPHHPDWQPPVLFYTCSRFPIIARLIYSAFEFAKALASIVTFCVMIWGLLELSAYASRLPQQPSHWISMSRLPLPSPTRALRCHVHPSRCEPRDQHGAVLYFLSEQIEHARALSSLSSDLGAPLRTFLDAHRATLVGGHDLFEMSHLVRQVDAMINSTELLGPSLLDFAPGSFIGRSLALGLDELDDLITGTAISVPYGKYQDGRLQAICWRITSNLLLEYSAARPRARELLQHVRALHQHLSPLASKVYGTNSTEKRTSVWWWKKDVARHPAPRVGDRMKALVTGLEITADNLDRLSAYLDWITEYLAQTTLGDVLNTWKRRDFLSTMTALQELFAQAKPIPPTPSKHCRFTCGITPPVRVDITVPGSPTVQMGR